MDRNRTTLPSRHVSLLGRLAVDIDAGKDDDYVVAIQGSLGSVGEGLLRSPIREQTMAGLTAARARGCKGGSPTAWTPAKIEVARSMYAGGQPDVATIAEVVWVSRASVYRVLFQGGPTC
jgi:hypothetical protein